MSQQITKVKARIKSVSGALKVTSAMKLVSTVKLKKWKNEMLSFKDYSLALEDVTNLVLKCAKKVNNPFTKNNETDKRLYIIFTSTLGLCGAYNSNIFKLADVTLKPEDDAIILGNKGVAHFENGNVNKIEGFDINATSSDSSFIKTLTNFIINNYVEGKYGEIHLIYSEYKNSLVFLPRDVKILPLANNDNEEEPLDAPLIEPTPQSVVETLVPIYIKTLVHSKFLESEVCEQAARSNAMENATDNAQEILDELKLQFNKARQAAITQEITEIVGASSAL